MKRFRERYYFWIPDASLGHRNALSVYQAAAFSRALYCSPTAHLDISTFRAGYPGADLRGSDHLPVQLFIYPECHKIDSQKFCPVRRWEGYPAFSLMCRWPNTTFHSLRCRGLWVRMFAYPAVQGTLPTFRSLFGRAQGHCVHVWAPQQCPCSHAATQPPASLTLSCVLTPWLGSDLPPPHRLAQWPQDRAGRWLLPAGLTPGAQRPSCPAVTLCPCSPPLSGCSEWCSAVLNDVHSGGSGANPQNHYFCYICIYKAFGVRQRFLITLVFLAAF